MVASYTIKMLSEISRKTIDLSLVKNSSIEGLRSTVRDTNSTYARCRYDTGCKARELSYTRSYHSRRQVLEVSTKMPGRNNRILTRCKIQIVIFMFCPTEYSRDMLKSEREPFNLNRDNCKIIMLRLDDYDVIQFYKLLVREQLVPSVNCKIQ